MYTTYGVWNIVNTTVSEGACAVIFKMPPREVTACDKANSRFIGRGEERGRKGTERGPETRSWGQE